MPNEKLPEINEHDAEELIHYPQDEEQKRAALRLLPGRWTRRCRKAAPGPRPRRVAEKTSEDHAYLMLGAVPFWAVGATSPAERHYPVRGAHYPDAALLGAASYFTAEAEPGGMGGPAADCAGGGYAGGCLLCGAGAVLAGRLRFPWESISSCWWRPRCCCRRIAIPRWITCGNSGDGRCAFCGTSALSSW